MTQSNTPTITDYVWRFNNLYYISDEDGNVIKFKPHPEQWEVIHAIYAKNLKKILILKARQLGMSTVIDLILLDQLLFTQGLTAAIVDLTQSDASKKLESKIKLAWNHLPSDLKSAYVIGKDSDKRFQLKFKSEHTYNDIQAGLTARGSTFQFIHVSEWGAIQHEDESRSTEILTGALPAAKNGTVVVETTWKGGRGGPLYENIVKPAIETPPEHRTDQDFHLFFFPWYTDSSYKLEGDASQIPPDITEYLDNVEKETSTTLSPSQRLWYYKVACAKGFFRFREYPSTLSECFKGLVEGAVYQDLVISARLNGRIKPFPISHDNLVHTFWDIGAPENTSTIFIQFSHREIHVIDAIVRQPDDLGHRVSQILSKGYPLGRHFLPHDALSKQASGKNFSSMLKDLGLHNLTVLPKPHSIWPGINHCQMIFPRFHFNTTNPQVETVVEALEVYRTKKDKALGYQTENPVHDWSSHIADPFRILAEAEMAGIFTRELQGLTVAPKTRRLRRQRLARTK